MKRGVIAFFLLLILATVNNAGAQESGLIDDLVSCWTMNETSGVRYDMLGVNNMSDYNTVQVAAGKIGSAALMDINNAEYLGVSDRPTISTGDIDFTIAFWTNYITVSGGYAYFVSKNAEYTAYINSSRFGYVTGNSGCNVNASTVLTEPNRWYFVLVSHDATNNINGIRVDNQEFSCVYGSGGGQDNSNEMKVGQNAGIIKVDEMAFWKRLLTSEEADYLYNNGVGRNCSEIILSVGPTPTPNTQRIVQLSSEDTALIKREISYGDISTTIGLGVLLLVVVIIGIIWSAKAWIR